MCYFIKWKVAKKVAIQIYCAESEQNTFTENIFSYIGWGKEGSEWTSCAFSNDLQFPYGFETCPNDEYLRKEN